MAGRTAKSKRASVAEYVLEQTGNCKDMIDFLIAMVRGRAVDPDSEEEIPVMATAADRKDAAKTLLEYGVGKPKQSVELDANINEKATVVVVPMEVTEEEWNKKAQEIVARHLAEVSD